MRRLLVVLLGAASTVLASTPRVICTSSNPAELSGNVTLTCKFQANLEVLQITWQKRRGKDTQNMVTCSEKYGTHITELFKKHITVLGVTSENSSIQITKLEKEDEACYNCLFNAYPNGAFTGEVCLTDLKSVNEVSCIGQGNDLRIDLNPQEIRTRASVQLIEKKTGDFSSVKGQYSDLSINPACEFWLEKESVKENQNHPAEDADKILTQCSASGNKKFLITWDNEGQPVYREDKVNITGNLITVTSTLSHTVSSLPADHRLKCTVTLSVPLEAYPEKAALRLKEPTLGNFNKGDTENKDQQNNRWTRYLMITSAGFLFLVILVLFLFYYFKVWKNKEVRTPKKQVEKGPETPTSSIKKLVGVIKEWSSPKFSTENESGPARSPSMNKGTPPNRLTGLFIRYSLLYYVCILTGDTENKDQQHNPWTRYLMITSAGFLFLVILVLLLFYFKVWKKKEVRTPKKQVEKGPETPPSSIKKLVGVIKEWSSPKFSTENESGPARSPSMNKGTTPNSDQRNPRENLESSVKKRNLRGSEKNTSSRRLQFISK